MVKNLFSVYSANLILGLIGIVSIPILLSNVGVIGYGYYGIYLIILSYLTLFELGILKHFVRLISNKNMDIKTIVPSFYYSTISIIIFSAPVAIVVIHKIFNVDFVISIILVLCATLEYAFHLPTKIYSSFATANKKFEKLSLFNLISGVIRYIIIIFGAIFIKEILIIIFLLALRRFLDIKLSKQILKEKVEIFDVKKINLKNIKKVVSYYKESIYLSMTQAFQINLMGIVSFAITRSFGVEGIGVFRSVYDVLTKIWFFSNGLGLVIFPYFSKGSIGIDRHKKYTYFGWVFYSFIFAVFLFLMPIINEVLLSSSLEGPEDKTMYLFTLVSVILIAQGNFNFEFLQADGKYKYLMFVTLGSNLIFLFGLLGGEYFLHNYHLVFLWMVSIIFQTYHFERKSLISSGYFTFTVLLMSLSWLFIGFYWI